MRKRHVLAATLFFILIFELLLPGIDSRAKADVLDGLAYLSGGLILYYGLSAPDRQSVQEAAV